jgi:hypothetical protein
MTKLAPPIFIVGCPHSGTSLMQAIVGSHSNIHRIKRETRLFMSSSIDECDRKMIGFYKRAQNNRKNRWIEKTPEHIHCLDRILENYKTAKIIIMIRDGRDVVASLYARIDYSLKEAVDRWIKDNTIALNFTDHPRVLLIKYEDLILNFENIAIRVFDFIGEEYEEAVKYFYEYQRAVDEPSSAKDRNEILKLREWQVSQSLFNGRGRYKELREYQYDYVYSRQKEMLIKFGYISETT